MTNLSDLHLHRTVVNGKGTNTSSRYRAIKNALTRYEIGQYKLENILIEYRENTNSQWHLDQLGQQSFREKAEKINPRTPKERPSKSKPTAAQKDAFNESIRHLAAVCKALATRRDMNLHELDILHEAIEECRGYLAVARGNLQDAEAEAAEVK